MAEPVKRPGGLRNVAVAESRVSSIDGVRGILAYRGIDIHALAPASTFEETVFLLHEGDLPFRARAPGLSEPAVGGAGRARRRRPASSATFPRTAIP